MVLGDDLVCIDYVEKEDAASKTHKLWAFIWLFSIRERKIPRILPQ